MGTPQRIPKRIAPGNPVGFPRGTLQEIPQGIPQDAKAFPGVSPGKSLRRFPWGIASGIPWGIPREIRWGTPGPPENE